MPETSTTTDHSAVLALFGVAAVLALVLAFTAVVMAAGDDSSAGSVSTAAPTHVSLSEFAIAPAAITVPEGGSLHVTNNGATAHNLTIVDEGIATADLPAGGSEELDVSSLAVGTYDVVCLVPGHADSGMTGTLEVTAGGGEAASATGESSDMAGMDMSGSTGDAMTEADYQAMSEAMNATISEFPAETGASATRCWRRRSCPTAPSTSSSRRRSPTGRSSRARSSRRGPTTGSVPGPGDHVDVGDKVQIVLTTTCPPPPTSTSTASNVPNAMDGVPPSPRTRSSPGGASPTSSRPTSRRWRCTTLTHGPRRCRTACSERSCRRDAIPGGRTRGEPVPADVEVSQEIPMVLNDAGVIGLSLNGKSFPATAPTSPRSATGCWCTTSTRARRPPDAPPPVRQMVIAKDGKLLAEPYWWTRSTSHPASATRVLYQIEDPGVWAWHCHILTHAERAPGMFGMVTALVVE